MPAAKLDQALRLDRQLDAMLAGIDPEEGQTHDDVAPTLHHLQLLFARPLPDPAFVDRLGRELTTPAADIAPGPFTLHANSGATQITGVTPQSASPSRWRRWDFAAALLVIAVLGGYLAVTSPDLPVPTPGPLAALTAQSELGIPDPAECQVEPRTVEQLEAIPAKIISKPRQVPASTPLSALTGEPADTATMDAVMMAERKLVACLNAQDALRAYALYTNDGLVRLFDYALPMDPAGDWTFEWDPDFSDLRLPPTPLPQSQRLALLSVEDIRILQDGRVMATVTISQAPLSAVMFGIPTGTAVVHIFQPGARYLIDEFIVPALGTPTP
jgi:hypothetical protein